MIIFKRFNSQQYLHNIERSFNQAKKTGSRKPYMYTGLGMLTVLGSWGVFMKYKSNRNSEIRNIYKKERNL